MAEMLIAVEAFAEMVPDNGEMSNHAAEGSAVNVMGVFPAWSVHAGGCGKPRHVRQV